MNETRQLRAAREHLSKAEAKYRTEEGLFHLEEGLALLEEVMASALSPDRTVAQNLAATYSTRVFACVGNLVETDRGLPEPDLEHLFKLVLVFDERGFELPADARATKISLVERLIERYYEGHSAQDKRAAFEQLAKISGRRREGEKNKRT